MAGCQGGAGRVDFERSVCAKGQNAMRRNEANRHPWKHVLSEAFKNDAVHPQMKLESHILTDKPQS